MVFSSCFTGEHLTEVMDLSPPTSVYPVRATHGQQIQSSIKIPTNI
jgi:hypothetical protein